MICPAEDALSVSIHVSGVSEPRHERVLAFLPHFVQTNLVKLDEIEPSQLIILSVPALRD